MTDLIKLERPIWFTVDECRLFGILHPPEDSALKCGVVFLNSGMQNRAGPHRLYVKTVRRLSAIGFTCLRIDFPGIGESEGDVGATHFDCHDPKVTRRAIDYLKDELGMQRIAVVGLCAGARNALKTAAMDDRVDDAVLWSMPIISISPSMPAPVADPRGWMSRTGAAIHLKKTLRKSYSVKAWRTYFSSGGDLRTLTISFRTMLWGLFSNEKKFTTQDRHKIFFDAFESIISNGPGALFLYGEEDTIIRQEFEDRYSSLNGGNNLACEYFIVPGGNHSFTSIAQEKVVMDKTVDWLARRRDDAVHH